MKVGGAAYGVPDSLQLTADEISQLKEIVPGPVTEEFVGGLNSCLRIFNWDGYDKNAATWAETRPELERLISALQKFESLFYEYSHASIGSPKAAAIYVACDPIAEWYGSVLLEKNNDAPFHRELSGELAGFLARAERNLELWKEQAKSFGREGDLNLGQFVFDLRRLQNKFGFQAGISTDRTTGELYSPFWELMIAVVSRIRNIPHAGSLSEQAALTFVKRALTKFRTQNPDSEPARTKGALA